MDGGEQNPPPQINESVVGGGGGVLAWSERNMRSYFGASMISKPNLALLLCRRPLDNPLFDCTTSLINFIIWRNDLEALYAVSKL